MPSFAPTRKAWIPAATASLLAAMLAPPVARAEIQNLSLYQKVGRAPVALWGEVMEGKHDERFASVRTLDLLKCTIPERPGETLRIAFRLDSFLRRPWQDRIDFGRGERVLLFLRPFTKQDGDRSAPDLYTLMWGAEGKVVLPAEGEAAWIEAARWSAQVLATQDLEQQARMLKDAVTSPNPHVAETAMEEVLQQGLSDLAMIPRLVSLFDAPREPLRQLSMRTLAALLRDTRTAGREVPASRDLTDQLRGHASSDATPEMRVEAVRALEALGGGEARAFLARLAEEDPSQLVRYEAKKALLGWKP